MNDRTKWNTKHKERLHELKEPGPNPSLQSLSAYLKGGYALDLACGLGGNSLFLARMNYQVQAIDISDVAINYVKEHAALNNIQIQPRGCDLTDLNQLNWQAGSFDLVVVTYYLDRNLFPTIKSIIKEGGYIFIETFYQSPQPGHQGISNQYKLQSKELLAEFGDWNVLFFEENEQKGVQTIFCQKH